MAEEAVAAMLCDLARNGSDMDAADEDGRTCLHLAAAYGHKHIVEFLANLGHGRVNLDAVDLQGRTALVYATQQNHQHVVRYLQARQYVSECLYRTLGK